MALILRRFFIYMTLILSFASPLLAETITCAECGMTADTGSKFSSKIIQGDKTIYFCDIGDMFSYMKRKKVAAASAQVKDYGTRGWIDASKAYYVQSDKKFRTPMGWGIASFKYKEEAAGFGEPRGFAEMMKAP